MAGHVTNLDTNFEDPKTIRSWVTSYKFPLITIENAYPASAHAPNHVTHELGVKNNYIFGIPDPDLPIHYKTFLGSGDY